MSEKLLRKPALLSFHIACAIYIKEYVRCPSGTGPSVWDAVGCSGGRRGQDAPCQLLSLKDLACSFGLSPLLNLSLSVISIQKMIYVGVQMSAYVEK